MTAKPNLHAGVWLLAEALCVLAITVKPSRHRWLFFVPVLAICAYALTCTMTDFRHLGLGERGISSRLPIIILYASTNILLCDPQREVRRIGQRNSVSDAPFLARLWWALFLWANLRGINYSYEPTSILPPRPTQRTRTAFVLAQLRAMLWEFFLFDVIMIMNRANPYYTKDTPVVEGLQWLWWFAGFGFGATIYTLLSMEYRTLIILLVLLGVSSPHDCPDYFGSPLDGYTVRRLWGKCWHQMLRRGCVVHADFVAKYFRLPQKTKTTQAVRLFVVFFLSGIVHWIGEAVPYQSLTATAGTLVFFLLQVVAIMAEEFAMDLGQRAGFTKSTRWTKAMGFLWVFLWFNFSLPYWTVPGYKGGWTDEFPDFSVIMGLWKGDWVPVNKPTS